MMRYSTGLWCLLGLFQLAFSQNSPGLLEGELKVWHSLTLTFEGPQTHEGASPNPFTDYRLQVRFVHADTTYSVPGYYAADGQAAESSASSGNKWRVHFTPDRPGVWTYEVSFRQGHQVAVNPSPQAGTPLAFDGASGSFTIGPSDKQAPDFRALGRLQYTGGHYLKFAATGEYYIKGGSDSPENFLGYYEFDNTRDHGGNPNALHTNQSYESQGVSYAYHNDGLHHYDPHLQDWQPGDPSWQGDKGKRIIGAINYLASEGVNVQYMLTNNVEGDGREVYPWIDYGSRNRYDVSKLAQWEIVFAHMQAKGIVLHFVLQETENDNLLDGGQLGTNRKLYYRELIARFGHHNALIWNLGEENDNSQQARDAFARYFEATDPYNHFLTVQTNIGQQNNVYEPLLGKSYFDGAAIQQDYWAVHQETKIWVDRSRAAGRDWVVFCDEIGPFQSGVLPDGPGNNHHSIRHQVLYANLFAGGAGNEWYFGYDYEHNDLDCEDFRSRDRIWDYTRYSVAFWKDFLPLERMRHADELVSGNAYCFANPGEIYLVYLPFGDETRIYLDSLDTPYRLRWFDPRNGGYLQAGSKDTVQGPGWQSLGLPPDSGSGQDWIAVVGVPNAAPAFQLSGDVLENENFEGVRTVEVIPDPVPADEAHQQVVYQLVPPRVSFAHIEFDSLSGLVQIRSIPEQSGSQRFTIVADDGQEVNNRFERSFWLRVSPPTPPVAVMHVAPLQGTAPLRVSFDGSQSTDLNGPLSQVMWNFGDGVSASAPQTTHLYTQAGTYTASLTVMDTAGMVHQLDTVISVYPPGREVLMVVGNTSLNAGDQAVYDSLLAWGYSPVLRAQQQATAADAQDKLMVLISSTVTSGVVGNTFTQAALPLLCWEPYLYDDLMMTGPVAGQDYGHAEVQDMLSDSLARVHFPWLPDSMRLTQSPARGGWGVPAASALPIGRLPGQAGQMGIFAYEAGAPMQGMAAPAMRIGMFWQDETPVQSTAEGWNIFRQLMCWATQCDADTSSSGPRLLPLPDQLHRRGDSVSLNLLWAQPTDSCEQLRVNGLPEGLTFDAQRMHIQGQITAEAGGYAVHISCQPDSSSAPDTLLAFHWIIYTPNPNRPPQIAYVPDQLHEQGSLVSLHIPATDPDGDSLFFAAEGLPQSLLIDSMSGEIYGPVSDSAGVYEVLIEVHDQGEPVEYAYTSFQWELIPPLPNMPPVLTPIADQQLEEGDSLYVSISATDPDEEDSLSYQVWGLPEGLSFDSLQLAISGQLPYLPGTYPIQVVVCDNGEPVACDTAHFTLFIQEKTYQALLVVGSLPLPAGDSAIYQRLQLLGFEVSTVEDAQVQPAQAAGMELVYVSSTVASWLVGDKFTTVEVPLIASEAYLYDDLGMASNDKLGNMGGQRLALLMDSTHIYTGGLRGLVNVVELPQEFGIGHPGPEAIVVASLPDQSQKSLIFAYETGSNMPGGKAPARRLGMFLRDETAAFLSQEGWALFDAAVCWAANCQLSSSFRFVTGLSAADEPAFRLFPNPTREAWQLEFSRPLAKPAEIRLYDAMGRLWLRRSLPAGGQQTRIPAADLPAGLYLLQLSKDNKLLSKRLWKR